MNGRSLHLIEVFIRVAETKSFTGAAARLGISPSAASKAVSRMEGGLGVRLLMRTTRSLGLTEEGEIFYARCRQLLSELSEVEATLSARANQPVGRVRIHSTMSFGRLILAPLLMSFSELWPEVSIDLDLNEREVNLHEEVFDVSFAHGTLSSSTIVARKVGMSSYVTVASPGYLAKRGTPQTPDQLEQHVCLGQFQPMTMHYRDWRYSDAYSRGSPNGHLNINNAVVLLDAAIEGHGIAQLGEFVARNALAQGRVVEVLQQFAPDGEPIWLTHLARRYQATRVRLLVDFLVERLPVQLRASPPAQVPTTRRLRTVMS